MALTDLQRTLQKKYPKWSEQTHVERKTFYAGSSQPVTAEEYVYTMGEIKLTQVTYPPALYKIIDEVIVNALDHVVRCRGGPHKVTEIRLTFDRETGKFTVRNDGPGIEIEVHPDYNLYLPQVIFGLMRTGSNLDKENLATTDDIIGGTNGVGVKITNIYSSEFSVETVFRGQKYYQKWVGGIEGESKPVITKMPPKSKEYTEISFIPRYHDQFKYNIEPPQIYDQISPIIAMRMYKASAYAGWVSNGQVTCYYNEEPITCKSVTDLANLMFPGANVQSTHICPCTGTITAKHIRDNNCNMWEVAFAYVVNTAKSMDSMHQITNVNGIAAVRGGHVEHIFGQLRAGIEKTITDELKTHNIKFQPIYIYSNVCIFINAKLAGAEWSSQRKDELTVDKKVFAGYQLPAKFINESGGYLRDKIMSLIYTDKSKKKKKLIVDKYTPARWAGTKKSEQCTLFLPEGDSAKTMCSDGIAYKPKGAEVPLLGYDRFGILTLGGVIMNARKDSTIVRIGDKDKLVMSDKLAANKFIKALLEVVGLNPNYMYDPKSPSYARERSQLRYGHVISCVDQDHDGVGFIHSLIINLFERFWPNLLAAGFVQRFVTPVRRAVPKTKRAGTILEFYNEYEYRQWAMTVDVKRLYDIEYIKGLASHTREDVIHMFISFIQRVYTYMVDINTHKIYEDYYGKETTARKQILSTRLEELHADVLARQRETRMISCSDHANYEAKAHMLSNIRQKLYSAVDGMNESGRKIFDGSRKKFRKNMSIIKVDQLAGFISENEAYHHGEVCLQQSISGKAFIVTGGVQLPQLLPRSTGLGSRAGGSSEISAARYTKVILNKKLTDLLYPEADMALLKYVVDDGDVVEPEYFVPILPMAVLESTKIPANGWRIKVWARDVFDVIENVRMLIRRGNADVPGLKYMRDYTRGYTGEIKNILGEYYSFGKYYYDAAANMIKITELPLREWTEVYAEKIRKKCPLADDVRNYSCNEYVDIEIDLVSGGQHQVNDDDVDQAAKPTPPTKKAAAMKLPSQSKIGAAPKLKASAKKPAATMKKVAAKPATPDIGGRRAIDIIMEESTTPGIDGVEEYFKLRQKLSSELNYIGKDGEVIEFKTYDDVIKYWWNIRKDLYRMRIERLRILYELKILYLENIIKFVREHKKLTLAHISQDAAEKLLADGQYVRFNYKLLKTPGLTPTDQLRNVILITDASYDYIFDIRERDKMTAAVQSRDDKLAKLRGAGRTQCDGDRW